MRKLFGFGPNLFHFSETNFEFGTYSDDEIIGTDDSDFIFAFKGNDVVDAGAGDDRVFLGSGDDIAIGGAGDDIILGGFGFDTVTYEGAAAEYTFSNGPQGGVTVQSQSEDVADQGTDWLRSIEALYFEADQYTLYLDGTNNAVLAGDDEIEGTEGTLLIDAATLLENDTEFDGDAISIISVADSAAGASVQLVDGQVTYAPGTLFDALQDGETVTDTFTYVVDDGKGGTDTATVTVTITGSNTAPVIEALESVEIVENTTKVEASISASDVDSSTLTYSISGGADGDLFEIDADTGVLQFIAGPDFEAPEDEGADNTYEVEVSVTDEQGASSATTIAVTVTDFDEQFILGQSFETEQTGNRYEFADASAAALPTNSISLENIDGASNVVSTDTDPSLWAFTAEWVDTRGDVGLSDGDYVGVTNYTGDVGAYTDGVQGYEINDPDGLYRITFEEQDLSAFGAVTVSIDYFVDSTSYELDDVLKIYLETDQGIITLIDTTGQDIDDLGIEGGWLTLTATLDPAVTTANLVVEFDSNSSSENLYIDNVSLTEDATGTAIVSQSFETETDGGIYDNDAASSDALPVQEVDLLNVDGLATVDSTELSVGQLGYDATWLNTSGGEGLSDGDYVGVNSYTGDTGGYTDGVQGYQMQDSDGLMRLTFDAVDLSEVGALEVSLDYFLVETGWESEDLLNIYVLTDQGQVILIDTTGQDIDDLGIEDSWNTLSVVLDEDVNSAQLVVELESNSSSESLYLDDVMLRELLTIGQSFEEEQTGGQYVSAAADGTLVGLGEEVDLTNEDGLAPVDSTTASANGLGFDATWVNTRGDAGLSDGDYVGVTDYAGTVGSYTDGSQGYELQDADGLMRLTFDEVDLTDAGVVEVSIDYFLQSTGWETDDVAAIYLITDQGSVDILNTAGSDIDDLGIEGDWITGAVYLGAEVQSAQLVVELDSNSSSESMYIDNIEVSELASGSTVSIVAEDAALPEGNSGVTEYTFTVSRTDSDGEASVDYNVSSTDADATDFGGELPSGTVTFADGETEATITIEVAADTDIEASEAFVVTLSNPTDGLIIDQGTAEGEIIDDDNLTLISEVQGSGESSDMVGAFVAVSAIVTYVVEDGFFVQEEDADADGDAGTSEGIFVFTGTGADMPEVGDQVLVTGVVEEYFDETQLAADAVTIESSNNDLPTAALIALSGDVAQDFEAVEGMRIELISGEADENITVIENYNLDRYGEITVSAGTQTQPTQLYDAQTEATEIDVLQEENANNRLIIDDGNPDQNPTEFTYIPNDSAGDNGNGYLDAGDDFSEGDTTLRLGTEIEDGTTGVMTFDYGEYKMLVDGTLALVDGTNEETREETPADVGGDIQVASFNVLNYFTSFSDGTATNPAGQARGADSQADLDRQTEKLVDALLGTGSEIIALQELENNGFDDASAIATLVDALNAEAALRGLDTVYAFVDPTTDGEDFVGSDAITTGLIYDTTQLTLTTSDYIVYEEASADVTFALVSQIEAIMGTSYVDDYDRNRPTVAATFKDADGNEITVASSHFKSKGDSGLEDVVNAALTYTVSEGDGVTQAEFDALVADLLADPNVDQDDGQGYWNGVRTDAASELEEWIVNDYAGTGSDTYLLLGDLNAYAQEDPVQELTDGDYDNVDLIDAFIGQDEAYSFVFDGQQGTLDQAIGSSNLAVTGVDEWNINSAEPDLFSYSSEYNDPAFYNGDQYGSSDHDPLIVGIDMGADEFMFV